MVESQHAIIESLRRGRPSREAGRALDQRHSTPASSLCAENVGAMTRQEIISEVGRRMPFFGDMWAEFCRSVEEYAKRVEGLVSSESPSETEKPNHRWITVPDEIQFGSAYVFVDILLENSFWMPNDLVNPASWFGLPPSSMAAELTYFRKSETELNPAEQVLHDAVVLSVAHDDAFKGKGSVPRIYQHGTYDRTLHFRCDDFVDALTKRLQPPDGDLEVQGAWDRIRHLVEPNGPGQPGETPGKGGKLSWLWRLYETTIKAACEAIIKHMNKT
jgi:hypothetical protein